MTPTPPSARARILPPADDLLRALDDLIAAGPLTVAFQPIVDLCRGEVLGYEVLGRCGPVAGPLAGVAASPGPLLELAHERGRLLALDRRWRELAVEAIARHAGDRGLFFLNVDPRVADDPTFEPGFTLALVERGGLPPERFVLELTETSCLDPAVIERVLRHYAEQGFRVALDDLGVGQAQLSTLLRLQPDIVKLDKGLLRGADTDPVRSHLIAAMAEFARRARMLLVVEASRRARSSARYSTRARPWARASCRAARRRGPSRCRRAPSRRSRRPSASRFRAVGPPTSPAIRACRSSASSRGCARRAHGRTSWSASSGARPRSSAWSG